MRTCSAFLVASVVLTWTACDKPDANTNSTAPANSPSASDNAAPTESAQPPAAVPTTSAVKKVDASGFKLGDYLPPLDGGRIELASPDGWKPAPRDSKYVVRFVERDSRGGLPRIDVIVEENNLGGFTDVTEANVAEFTAAVAKDLEANGTAVLEPPIPMVIGSVPCARYVSYLKLKIGAGGTILAERQTLELLHAGRRYKINLLVMPETLLESRDAAYAVCAGIRFPAAAPPPATDSSAD